MDQSFYLLFNAHYERLTFTLPEPRWGQKWRKILATNEMKFTEGEEIFAAGDQVVVEARSVTVLCRTE